MDRRTLLKRLLLAAGALAAGPALAEREADAQAGAAGDAKEFPPVNITREQWKEILPADRYRILFREGTEPAGSSPLDEVYDPGTYICAACYLPLFASEDKFDSGTGWPSFLAPIEGAPVGRREDRSLFMRRTEVHCSRCGGHLGHVFNDGPAPTGLRYCINSVSLKHQPAAENE